MSEPPNITELLSAESDQEAVMAAILPVVYHQLKHLARQVKSNHRVTPTLSTTALVHDAYLKLNKSPNRRFQSRSHFFRSVAQAMRHILVDVARSKLSHKRHGIQVNQQEVVLEWIEQEHLSAEQLLHIDHALEELSAVDENTARVVELHFFAGFSFADIAALLDTSESSIYRMWRKARAFLFTRVQPD